MGENSGSDRSVESVTGAPKRKWRVREAGDGDVDALHLLETRGHSAPWPREAFEEELVDEHTKIWVIESGARLAAMMVFWRTPSQIEVLDIVVDPDFQRQGMATVLLEMLIAVAPTGGVRRIALEVRVSNDRAQKLYRKLGFVRAGRRPDYYEDNGEDAFVMVRTITDEEINLPYGG